MSTLPPRMSATRSFSDCGLIHRVGIDRIGVEDRLADIAEGLIDAREPERGRQAVDGLPRSPRWNRDGSSAPSTTADRNFPCSPPGSITTGSRRRASWPELARTTRSPSPAPAAGDPLSLRSNSACSRPHTAGSSHRHQDCAVWRSLARSARSQGILRRGNRRRARGLRPHFRACTASPPAARTPASRLQARCRDLPVRKHATSPRDTP